MHVDWNACRTGKLDYSYARFSLAKSFVFRKWCEMANERALQAPDDLSGACKYGSLFMNRVFGGSIRGHFQHQYNYIGGRIVDLGHDAADVGAMPQPYLHEPEFFELLSLQRSLAGCLPRVDGWVIEFLAELAEG
ncbi:transcriptional regulator [Methyloversatilis sp.]|uniref:transcriptional regulator n=1 Tax=Methyloversatilis sp. TaxID=2569862 RepID=UPI0035B10DE2